MKITIGRLKGLIKESLSDEEDFDKWYNERERKNEQDLYKSSEEFLDLRDDLIMYGFKKAKNSRTVDPNKRFNLEHYSGLMLSASMLSASKIFVQFQLKLKDQRQRGLTMFLEPILKDREFMLEKVQAEDVVNWVLIMLKKQASLSKFSHDDIEIIQDTMRELELS